MEKIIGQIVLYNPEIERLEENIHHVINQVEKLLLVDNNSSNYIEIEKLLKKNFDKVILIQNTKNKGIAYALNQGLEYAKANGYDWILTLDQDSVFPFDGISEYIKYSNYYENVGIYCPRVFDSSMQELSNNTDSVCTYVEEAITSGALTNVDIGNKLKYDDWMFIDEVDHEFSWRMIKSGYRIVQVNSIVLNHQIGQNGKIKKLFGHEEVIFNHSAFRKYYMVRNQLYFMLKKGKKVTIFHVLKKIVKFILIILLWEDDKIKKIKAVIRGGNDFEKYKRKALENDI